MQSDPKEAERRFKGDPDVDEFIKEFGKIMSSHFSSMGNTDVSPVTKPPAPVQEIGPLHARAISSNKQTPAQPSSALNEDDKRLKEVVFQDTFFYREPLSILLLIYR